MVLKQVDPDTERMVEGFRDTGYSFNAAIADIVDNSIAADAANVSIYVELDDQENALVWVGDDGHGMDSAGVENAMRYGSKRREDPHSLGRFGLGLKTASTSFCRELTVISKPAGGDWSAATWDLDRIAKENAWLLELRDASEGDLEVVDECLSAIGSSRAGAHGTVVSWSKVDRLLRTKSGSEAKNKTLIISRLCRDLEIHLRTVFERFLDASDVRVPHVRIWLNDVELSAWNPFCQELGSEEADHRTWQLTAPSGKDYEVELTAYILPRPEEFGSVADREAARLSNDNQGIYLYRENRLIEGPHWLGLYIKEPHLNNLRVSVSFPAPVDEVFGVGIKKSGVHVDPELLEEFRDVLAPVRREANTRSRKGKAAAAAKSKSTSASESTISQNLNALEVASLQKGEEGQTVLHNNKGDIEVVDAKGRATGFLRLLMDDGEESLNVIRRDSLEDGVLWAPAIGSGRVQVALNTGHDWFRKTYIARESDSTLVQAIEYLLYGLAQAEMNNTEPEMDETFQEFRREVSKNLRRLVKHLPEPADE